ncbi:MAG: FAD-dependent oxidoreductase [Polyangiales bacterium]
MAESTERTITTQCCIAGAGPAGMVLGLLLARAGVRVTLLEKHPDFERDFRGETVHPSTLQLLSELGIRTGFDSVRRARIHERKLPQVDGLHPIIDFRGMLPLPYRALVPQWDFLAFLADEARRHPGFALHMQAEVTDLMRDGRRITGVVAHTPDGPLRVHADVVVGCDGRQSEVRARAGLSRRDRAVPMDVLWFRLPRAKADTAESFAVAARGHCMALLQRGRHWQVAYILQRGWAPGMLRRPIEELREVIEQRVGFLAGRTAALQSWADVKRLEVRVDRLKRWFQPGLLLIGDAAHAMASNDAVGINLAIQDAVTAAHALIPALRRGQAPSTVDLARVQLGRSLPTQLVHAVQQQIHERMLAPMRRTGEVTPLLRGLLELRSVPTRLHTPNPAT